MRKLRRGSTSAAELRSPPLSKSELLASCKSFQTGRLLGNNGYRMGRHISGGATGDVFIGAAAPNCAAFGDLLGADGAPREVALKQIKSSSASNQRQLQQEIVAVFQSRLKYAEETNNPQSPGHPNIVAYLDWFGGPAGVDREVYLVMELCQVNLNDIIFTAGSMRSQYERQMNLLRKSNSGPVGRLSQTPNAAESKRIVPVSDPSAYRFTEREIVKVMRQMLSALLFLNQQGLAHRDVKAENILWAESSPEGTYKLADFGTAAFFAAPTSPSSSSLSPGGALPEPGNLGAPASDGRRADDAGTLWIMAPELLGRRPHGLNCDVWSLGVVLFEVVSLGKPFNSKELLAYRNSPEAVLEGSFWPFICSSIPGLSGSGPCGSTPASPTSGGKVLPPLERKPKEAPLLHEIRRSSVSALRHGATPPCCSSAGDLLARSRRKSMVELDGSRPTSPTSPSAVVFDPLRARRNAFLKKRCCYRWCYSEELRGLIFDELLQEDADLRPSAAAALQGERASALLVSNGLQESCPEPPPLPEGSTASELLRRVTAEAIMLAGKADKAEGGQLAGVK